MTLNTVQPFKQRRLITIVEHFSYLLICAFFDQKKIHFKIQVNGNQQKKAFAVPDHYRFYIL